MLLQPGRRLLLAGVLCAVLTRGGSLGIRNVSVITGTGARPLEHATVLVRGETIKVPADAATIAMKRNYVGNVAHALSVPRRHSCRRLGEGRNEFRPGRLKPAPRRPG